MQQNGMRVAVLDQIVVEVDFIRGRMVALFGHSVAGVAFEIVHFRCFMAVHQVFHDDKHFSGNIGVVEGDRSWVGRCTRASSLAVRNAVDAKYASKCRRTFLSVSFLNIVKILGTESIERLLACTFEIF